MQKGMEKKEDCLLFKSPTKAKWKDATFMKLNVCLLSVGNEESLKRPETPVNATCPNFERHKVCVDKNCC